MTESFGSSEVEKRLTLSPADGAAVDALLAAREQAGFHLQGAGQHNGEAIADEARVGRVKEWLRVLGAAAPPAPSAALLEHTLAAVQAERMKFDSHANHPSPADTQGGKRPRKWSHLGEIAAMVVAAMLLVAVLIPAIGQARMSYRRTLCATNLAAVGAGFNLYASDNQHELPCLASAPGANWLRPEAGGHTNTDNLLPLLNASYLSPQRLVCAGQGLADNAAAVPAAGDIRNCGYSYINMFGPARPTWNGNANTIVLADRNPLFTQQGAAGPDENSHNHGQKGNYVLHADGHASWELSPNIGPDHDNIWTLGSGSNRLLQYVGTEVATSTRDVFLSP